MTMSDFPKQWLDFCEPRLAQDVAAAEARVAAVESSETIYPVRGQRYRALAMPPEEVSVVILGQDPYHGEDACHGSLLPQAMGLSFSVPEGMPAPRSLKNIAKELESDVGSKLDSGDLTRWTEQGVLLLNTSLTVRKAEAGSHKDFGWQAVTDHIIAALGQSPQPRVFILWGAHAQAKRGLIGPQHLIIESAHPSPLSAHRGFFGSRPFSRANAFLKQHGRPEIRW
jgi:uracil-DNA glycosylase